jgi:hypothetical protein
MKKLVFILTFSLISLAGFAQAPYLGGDGDGYEMQEGSIGQFISPPTIEEVRVFPNRILAGESIELVVENVINKLEVRIVDVLGRTLWVSKLWEIEGKQNLKVPTQGLSQGKYLLDIRRDGNQFIRPFIILGK